MLSSLEYEVLTINSPGVRLKALAYPTPLSHSGNPFSSSFDPIKVRARVNN